MRRSKSGHERNNSRRRSWFSGNNLFTMFASAPPSPDRKRMILEGTSSVVLEPLPLTRQCSQSLQPAQKESITATPAATAVPTAVNSRPKAKSTFSSIISKATKKHHKRKESSNLTQDSQSSIFDYSSSLRRGSNKSDATSISDMDIGRNEPSIFLRAQQKQLLKSDEEEADRIQLKNDLVKLAFEG
jgi:hypothetical protein